MRHSRCSRFESQTEGSRAQIIENLFQGVTYLADMDIALGCWRHIRRLFEQMDEFRAFELMRSGRDRTEYLLVKVCSIFAFLGFAYVAYNVFFVSTNFIV
jgi:hypothetical protein